MSGGTLNPTHSLTHALSLSFLVRGAGDHLCSFQEVPKASWIGCDVASWPSVPPDLGLSWTVEHTVSSALWQHGQVADSRRPIR